MILLLPILFLFSAAVGMLITWSAILGLVKLAIIVGGVAVIYKGMEKLK